jgi:hypothetical protein
MGKKHDETLSLVRDAIRQLKRGDTADALTTLERCAYPKWGSTGECGVDLLRHNQEAALSSAAG